MREVETGAVLRIGAVARRTGLSEHVLRAWERRHGVVAPARSRGGVRLYTAEEVVRLRLLRQATQAGYSIGAVAGLDLEQLHAISAEDGRGDPTRWEGGVFANHGQRCLRAIEALDGRAVHSILSSAAVSLSLREFTEEVVTPLLDRVGALGASGWFGPAQEHVLTVSLRDVLGWLLDSIGVDAGAPVVVVTTISGERHEIGAMLAAITAAGAGWRVSYFGADLPAADIATAARVKGATVVVVSVVVEVEEGAFRGEMETLRAALGPAGAVLVGGEGARAHAGLLTEPGIRLVRDLPELRIALNELTATEERDL